MEKGGGDRMEAMKELTAQCLVLGVVFSFVGWVIVALHQLGG